VTGGRTTDEKSGLNRRELALLGKPDRGAADASVLRFRQTIEKYGLSAALLAETNHPFGLLVR